MTVESYNVIAIASLSDWPKNIAPVFQTMTFSRALTKLQVVARNSDWLIALLAPVVIGPRNCFSFGFS